MEIEKKFTVREIPYELSELPFHQIEQAYLCTDPVIRIRRQDDSYFITYKSEGLMEREEYNLPLTRSAYEHLLGKADGNIITKKRYLFPLPDGLTIELDIFEGLFSGLVIAEVEFSDRSQAESFIPPAWFDEDVTNSGKYHNSYLSQRKL